MAPADINVLYEPFFGGGAFFFGLPATRYSRAVLSDVNCELIEMYEAIREFPEHVIDELDKLQGFVSDKVVYYHERARSPSDLTPARRAARFIYLNKTGYNGLYRVNKRGQFNVPFGRYSTPPRLYDRGNVLEVSRYLKAAELRCGDFEEVLSDAHARDFVYMDPPYAPLSSTANFTNYTRDSFTEFDQRRLAALVGTLTDRGCRVLVSNSDTPLVRTLYKDYNLTVIYVPRRVNSDAGGRGKIAELAIRNYQ